MSIVALTIAGCRDDEPVAPTTPVAATLIDDDARTHHFGAVVSRPGKTLEHRFRLANTTSHAIKLADVINRKSCCGAIKVGAMALPPGGSTEVVVTLMVGNKFGDVVHETEVVTDPPSPGEIVLRLVAQAVPAIRVEQTSAQALSFVAGTGPQAVEFLVTANGTDAEPPIDLDVLTLTPPADARWLGPKRDAASEESANAISRHFAVTLDPSGSAGERSTAFGLRTDSITVYEHVVAWEIVPALSANPRVAILPAGSRKTRLLIRAQGGRSFRVTRVESSQVGISATCTSSDSLAAQVISVNADAPVDANLKGQSLTIFTDLPAQASVRVPVIIQE